MSTTILPSFAGCLIMGSLVSNSGTSATLQVQTREDRLPTNVTALSAESDTAHSGAAAMLSWAGFVSKSLPPTRSMTKAERKASAETFWALFD